VYLREADVSGELDPWLGQAFDPANLDATLDRLTDQATAAAGDTSARAEAAQARIADLDKKIAQYRASLDAGAPLSSAPGSPRPRPRRSPPGPRSAQPPASAG
jgi:hypothetical protein